MIPIILVFEILKESMTQETCENNNFLSFPPKTSHMNLKPILSNEVFKVGLSLSFDQKTQT